MKRLMLCQCVKCIIVDDIPEVSTVFQSLGLVIVDDWKVKLQW
jgi:hypothetical protein